MGDNAISRVEDWRDTFICGVHGSSRGKECRHKDSGDCKPLGHDALDRLSPDLETHNTEDKKTVGDLRAELRRIAVKRREDHDFSKVSAAELIEHFAKLMENASPLPWSESWDTKRNGDGWAWMEASGRQTMALKEDDPQFQELVVDRAYADAKLMADAVNALPRFIELLRDSGSRPEGENAEGG